MTSSENLESIHFFYSAYSNLKLWLLGESTGIWKQNYVHLLAFCCKHNIQSVFCHINVELIIVNIASDLLMSLLTLSNAVTQSLSL